MTDLELAEEIERKATIGDGHVALTDEKWQQIIAALRRGPEHPPSGEMVMVPRIYVESARNILKAHGWQEPETYNDANVIKRLLLDLAAATPSNEDWKKKPKA